MRRWLRSGQGRGGRRDHVRELPQVFAVAAREHSVPQGSLSLSTSRRRMLASPNLSANFVPVNQTNGSASFWTNLITTLGTLRHGELPRD
jgi:hypothetical protein